MKQGTAPKKRYYSNIPGSRFIFSDASEAAFNYGFFDSTSRQEQEELDAILGKNPTIYTAEKLVVEVAPPMPQSAKSEAEIAVQDSQLSKVTGRETGEINTGASIQLSPPEVHPGIFTPPASTIDLQLQAAMNNAGPVNPTIAPPPNQVVSVGNTAGNNVSDELEIQPEPIIGPGVVASNPKLDEIRARIAASRNSTS